MTMNAYPITDFPKKSVYQYEVCCPNEQLMIDPFFLLTTMPRSTFYTGLKMRRTDGFSESVGTAKPERRASRMVFGMAEESAGKTEYLWIYIVVSNG